MNQQQQHSIMEKEEIKMKKFVCSILEVEHLMSQSWKSAQNEHTKYSQQVEIRTYEVQTEMQELSNILSTNLQKKKVSISKIMQWQCSVSKMKQKMQKNNYQQLKESTLLFHLLQQERMEHQGIWMLC